MGWIATIVIGGAQPGQAVLSAYLIGALLIPDKFAMQRRANFLSIWWILIVGVEFLAFLVQGWGFGYASEKMVSKAKKIATNRRLADYDTNYFALS